MAHAEQFLKIVNDAKKRVKETNVADVKRRQDSGEKFVLVDVRSRITTIHDDDVILTILRDVTERRRLESDGFRPNYIPLRRSGQERVFTGAAGSTAAVACCRPNRRRP